MSAPWRGPRRPLAAAVAVAALWVPAAAVGQGFEDWVADLRREARTRGVSEAVLDRALSGAAVLDRVLDLQERQPEATLSWAEYARRVVPASRVAEGRRRLAAHAGLLDEVSQRFGVQPRFVVALWGIESDFGRQTGGTPAVAALATLAFGGRRRDYFRTELIELLLAAQAGYTEPAGLTSSWAGALGQCQFMPSNFRRFAVDWDGDGRRDIWGTTGDVLASIARFLNHLGWKDDETWGRPVVLPPGFDERLAGEAVRMTLSRWSDLGVSRPGGGALPDRDLWATLILPDGPSGEAFLVYDDFFTLRRWNRSTNFALAVGRLSDALR